MAQFLTRQSIGLILLIISLVAFMVGLGHPNVLVFDETHYVPAARAILDLSRNTNPEHPLVAKEFIAAGIALFGDNPFGWRFFGALLTALSVYAVYQIALNLLKDAALAAMASIFLSLSFTVTIQARTAMLDSYAFPLMILSAAFFISSAHRAIPKFLVTTGLVVAGIFLGLAAGAKWITGIYAMLALFGLFLARLFKTMSTGRPLMHALWGRDYPSWQSVSFFYAALVLGITSLFVYFLTFAPALFWKENPLSVFDIFSFQFVMLDRQTMPLAENSYESEWWEWPLMLEPIWYHFESVENGGHEAILYVGNPFIFWGGLIAVLVCLVQGVRNQNGVAFGTALAFLASWLIFAVLPKQIGFFFYYHGSGILLCFAFAVALSLIPKGKIRWGIYGVSMLAALAVFAFFFPVIYAIEMPREQWTNYLWLPNWN